MAKTYATLALLKSGFRTDYGDINQTEDHIDDWIQLTQEMFDLKVKQVSKQYAFLLNTDNGLTVSKKIDCKVKKTLHYKKGTVSVVRNTKIITGNGTTWATDSIAQDDWIIIIGDSIAYRIDSIDSNTQITLKNDYLGNDKNDSAYAINRDGLITIIKNPFESLRENWETNDTKTFSQKVITGFSKSYTKDGTFIGEAAGDFAATGIEIERVNEVTEVAKVVITWRNASDLIVQKIHVVTSYTIGGVLKLSKAAGVDGTIII